MVRARNHRHPMPGAVRGRTSFTLAELLVVLAIIAIVAVLTVIAVGRIADNARLSSGRNTVVAALENARATAMKRNRLVMVAFRARPAGPGEQVIEAVTAEWSGESYLDRNEGLLVDRFVPVTNVPVRVLPAGIKVAAPLYLGNVDTNWAVSTHLPAVGVSDAGGGGPGEAAGPIIAVMYDPDGATVTQNVRNDSDVAYVDFNGDSLHRQAGEDFDYDPNGPLDDYPDNAGHCDLGSDDAGSTIDRYYCQRSPDDEPYVLVSPFLALVDDDEARELNDVTGWGDGQTRVDDLTRYITERADRIHFNRYTGVVMK